MVNGIFDPNKLLFIAGPCSLESEALCETVAETLVKIQEKHGHELTIVFKTSFDKANRTDVHSRRGLGLEKSLGIFSAIKQRYGLPILTDVHLPQQATILAKFCDVLQVPAFLCRQTDLLEAIAKTGKTVNIKKGQFLSPFDMKFVVEKLRYFGAKEIWQTDRGTTFGYGCLVVDMRSFPIMKQNHCPTILDVTHSLQIPSSGAGTTGGDRQYALPLSKAALAAGAQGLFIETHPNPAEAWSDKATQIPLNELPDFIERCLTIWNAERHNS